MNKLFDLRETLLKARLNIEPENITVMTKAGKVTHHYRREHDLGNNKFKKTFDIDVFIFNHCHDIDPVLTVVSQWLTKNQPGHAEDLISYELEILNHEQADLLVTIKGVTETVSVTKNDKGTYIGACKPEHVDEIVRADGVVSVDGDVVKAADTP